MYIILWEFVPIKLPVQLIWASFLNCNCQKMALKQDGMPFVLSPKQGSKVEVFVLNKVYFVRYKNFGNQVHFCEENLRCCFS